MGDPWELVADPSASIGDSFQPVSIQVMGIHGRPLGNPRETQERLMLDPREPMGAWENLGWSSMEVPG